MFKTRIMRDPGTGYFKVDISADIEAWVKARVARFRQSKRYTASTPPSRGLLGGMYGEAIFKAAFPDAVYTDQYDHDYRWNGFSVEVKTSWSNHPPHPACHHLTHCHKAKPTDAWAFALVQNDCKTGWLVGWLPWADLQKTWVLRYAGEKQYRNGYATGFNYHHDNFEVKYRDLRPFAKIKECDELL